MEQGGKASSPKLILQRRALGNELETGPERPCGVRRARGRFAANIDGDPSCVSGLRLFVWKPVWEVPCCLLVDHNSIHEPASRPHRKLHGKNIHEHR